MKFLASELPEVIVIEPDIYRDERGFFLESYQARKYAEGGIAETFVQHNHSLSVRGVLRGLHAQRRRPQGKLVRVLRGEVFDVAVDIRRGSPTFAHWRGVTLSAENFLQCYIPPGFAHGFCVLSDGAEFEYKSTDFYDPDDQLTVRWNDPQVAVKWPIDTPILSAKDREAPLLAEIADRLPIYDKGGHC